LKVSNEESSDTSKSSVSPNVHAPSRHFDTLKTETEGSEAEKEPVLEWEA